MLVFITVLLCAPARAADLVLRIGLACILGGALGNLYDRVVNGTVTDFVEVYAGTHYFPAFNVADSGISVGAGLLLLDMWRGSGKKVEPEMFPKLISIGSFFLPTYGVLVALGFLAALWIVVRLAKRANLSPEAVTNLAIYCALAGLAGAKLFMFLFNFRDYWNDPKSIFTLGTLQAAGVYQGGFLVALVVAILYMRHVKLPVLPPSTSLPPASLWATLSAA